MKEVWKPIKGFKKKYEISNTGKVKSMDMKLKNRCSYWIKKGRILTELYDQRGYPMVHLCVEQRHITKRIHTLVWDAFGKRKRNGRKLQVDHIDNNKLNNKITNLQLLSSRLNNTKKFNGRKLPTGVYERKDLEGFTSQIGLNGKTIYLGSFKTIKEAAGKYREARKLMDQKSAREYPDPNKLGPKRDQSATS